MGLSLRHPFVGGVVVRAYGSRARAFFSVFQGQLDKMYPLGGPPTQ